MDFGELIRGTRRISGGLADLRQDLMSVEANGHAADGAISATVSGDGRVVDLRIDESAMNSTDPRTLAEYILAAIDNARQSVSAQSTERISTMTEGIGSLLDRLRNGSNAPQVTPRLPRPDPRRGRQPEEPPRRRPRSGS
ncbi:YbaB/EbfC family nucleoid-associated protein [Streptomyces sp. PTM05]|uniref:YbaB/EbfC family nucleoid-associated protein n=1 Tax=Streptantibioticus parmotrematis TaxID=2873249 RepID=A0ABS7QUU4_9ACTN|nr:YbaB/EbfC family nucleoid-associated protein [Streptantibioticus parmotrematis]MBY8886976.1 YbaB/EbfC family nucleoid-associated protein [Streptantibioticus parmotrematis]